MALKSILSLRDSVSGILSGIDISTVADLNGCFQRAAATMIQKCSPPETSGIQNITLYSGVFDYLCDPSIYGTAISDIRPQGVSRQRSNFVTKGFADDFDRNKTGYTPIQTTSAFEYKNGVPIIKILSPYPRQKVNLDPMTDITDWVASGSASTLIQDTSNFYQYPASMRTTLTGASTGILTKTIDLIDIASYEDVGVAFLAIEMPSGATATDLTNIVLKVGSDSGNYNNITQTTGFLGSWVSGNWLIVSFDFSSASQTGTPDWSAITYLQVSLTHGATLTNFRVGGLWISMPTPAQIYYKSAAIFLPVGSTTTLTTITLNTDEIILTDPTYNIYLHECALEALLNTGASDNDSTSLKINRKLNGDGITGEIGLYKRYTGDNPSQDLRVIGSWYSNEQGYGGYGGSYYNNNY